MKRILLITLFTMMTQLTFGQVALIKDSDGWTNVRKEPNGNAKVIHKIYGGEVFWYNSESTDKEQDWISIYIPKNKFSLGNSDPTEIEGFIHKSRLLPLDSLKSYTGTNFKFNYEIKAFDQTNRIVGKQDDRWITSIDGRPVWGTDGDFPKTEVNNISVEINGLNLEVHKVFFSDIYECDNSFSVYESNGTFFVYQWNSDGAGAYQIVWVFDKSGLKQRLVGSII
ncbi:hypothetical protein EO244_12635 [Ancylomarina salipaludis]|uniref:SH3 domain-containing protein n=1 Tax=Ancylomarina salipaludis TaxID=2501299 RepID=A0A4Q1JJ93_9BACT|nr:hypothetical protein [Ancylomarina salipaludis]RXQ90945.1 hypothetical protein EO244_12635 [Ancylomarina salipaludis]